MEWARAAAAPGALGSAPVAQEGGNGHRDDEDAAVEHVLRMDLGERDGVNVAEKLARDRADER